MDSVLIRHPSRQSSIKSQQSISVKKQSTNANSSTPTTNISLTRKNSEKLIKNIIINNKENEILNKIDLEDMCPEYVASELMSNTSCLLLAKSHMSDSPSSSLSSSSSTSSQSSTSSNSSPETDTFKINTNTIKSNLGDNLIEDSHHLFKKHKIKNYDEPSIEVITSKETNESQPLILTQPQLVKTVPMLSDTSNNSEHHFNPHHRIHRHRHVHHHRNYEGHIHLHTADDNLNGESVDDPNSISSDVTQNVLSTSITKQNSFPANYFLFSPDKIISTNNNGADSSNAHLTAYKNNNRPYICFNDENNAVNIKEMNESVTDNEMLTINYLTENIVPLLNKTHSNSSKSINLHNSLVIHRSTPNLSNMSTDSESNTNENMLESDNENKNNIINSNNLKPNNLFKLKLNFPSNLELSTNLDDFQDQLNPIILNNEIENLNNDKKNLKLNNKLILNNCLYNRPNTTCSLINHHGILINNNTSVKKLFQRYKLITEGDVHVCKLPNSRNYISKILNSKLLRRWKAHRLFLTDTEIYSGTKTDYMDSSIPYHTVIEISPISKWEPGQKYCLRVATIECHYLIQTNNAYVRDQWIHSIIWKKHKFKSERILKNAVRQEVLIKEIKNLIEMSLTTQIDDTEIYSYPLELISEILQKHRFPKQAHEEIIVSLSPLLEKNHPSPEICDFFSKHCIDSPRSHIVIEMFTPVVQRILKHNGDFGKYPRMRLFIQDYLMALISQNDGLQTVQNFVRTMHSTSSQCPFSRVLPNFVAVCLAAIHGCFEQRKNYKSNIPAPPVERLTEQERKDQLECYTTMMYTMSKFEDWRAHLAQLLQSVPFPDQSLVHNTFITIFKKVIENFADDTRCEVHQALLGIREGKEGWFEIFCPGGISCDDNGELFAIMLQRLIGCCCKKKRFLLSINKLLSQIIVLASREVPSAIETLCAMLDLDGIENLDDKLQIINTLQSTPLGQKMYAKVCERQAQLRELQQKGGPRKLTLPSRSTDEDLAKLLLSGSFGNLECLSLAFTNVTSACAEYLIKLPSLRYLNLWSTKFGDEGLELISEHLQRLQVLNLCETPVTDKGLACLASMKQLRKLNLNSTNLSELTFEGLKECLPALQECDIRYTDAW